MSSISVIGSRNMAGAIGALALKGGNAVEVIGRDAAAALARALGDGATAGTWGATPAGDIVILAVLFDSAVPVVSHYGDALDGADDCNDQTNPEREDHYENRRSWPWQHRRDACAAVGASRPRSDNARARWRRRERR